MIKITSHKGNIEAELEGTSAEILADASLAVESIIKRLAKTTGKEEDELKAKFITGLIVIG